MFVWVNNPSKYKSVIKLETKNQNPVCGECSDNKKWNGSEDFLGIKFNVALIKLWIITWQRGSANAMAHMYKCTYNFYSLLPKHAHF